MMKEGETGWRVKTQLRRMQTAESATLCTIVFQAHRLDADSPARVQGPMPLALRTDIDRPASRLVEIPLSASRNRPSAQTELWYDPFHSDAHFA